MRTMPTPQGDTSGRQGLELWLRVGRDGILIALGSIALLALATWALGHVINVVLVVLLALFFETLLQPFVNLLSERWPRPWAVLAVVLAALLVFGVGGGYLMFLLASQIVGLLAGLPKIATWLNSSLPGFLSCTQHSGLKLDVVTMEDRLLSQAGQISTFVVSQTLNVLTQLITAIADALVILFLTVYLLLDANRIQLALFRLVPNDRRETALSVQHTLGRVVGGYVRAQVLMSLLVGAGFALGSWWIGLPYPLLIGALSSFFELIPLLGPILGIILPAILAILSRHPLVTVFEVALMLIVIHLLESQILAPRLIRSQVGIHPILSIVSLMLGAQLGGLWGAVFAIPVAGILVAAWVGAARVWRESVVLPQNRQPP